MLDCYPVINSDLDMLGGLLARIDKGKYNPNIHKSFMLNKNNLIKVVWMFYHVFPLTDHVGLHHT